MDYVIASLIFARIGGVPLSEGKLENDQIICSYHGWRFDSNGSCVEIPSLKKSHNSCLKSLNLIEKDGFIFLSFSKNTNFEEIPSITISNYDRFYWKYEIQGDLIDLIENFLDATHKPFIHNFLIRSNKAPKLIQAELERMNEMVRITHKGESSQQGLISKIFEKKRAYIDAVFQMPNSLHSINLLSAAPKADSI